MFVVGTLDVSEFSPGKKKVVQINDKTEEHRLTEMINTKLRGKNPVVSYGRNCTDQHTAPLRGAAFIGTQTSKPVLIVTFIATRPMPKDERTANNCCVLGFVALCFIA